MGIVIAIVVVIGIVFLLRRKTTEEEVVEEVAKAAEEPSFAEPTVAAVLEAAVEPVAKLAVDIEPAISFKSWTYKPAEEVVDIEAARRAVEIEAAKRALEIETARRAADLAATVAAIEAANRAAEIEAARRAAAIKAAKRVTALAVAAVAAERQALVDATVTIADPEEFIRVAKEKQLEELGITEPEVETYQEFALRINEELGGRYVGGMLTPPASWTGSVTEWSRHVQRVTAERWQ